MGVPKFLQYICRRYPCLEEIPNDYQMPEFDVLYLDMNGIIYSCSHSNDADPHFCTTEEEIFENIFHYLEILFNMIKPLKLFFVAIDGVPPRAKINQQRCRKFKDLLRGRREEIPKDAKFDSNCIIPGTVFMSRLSERLKYFVTLKISTNELWKKCKIILNGPEVPGEGECKILDHIRYMKAQPDYDPNTRHCLYGLDADLVIQSLCTHEPNFALLREEVKYCKRLKKCPTPGQSKFSLLYISLLREYLEHEFSMLKDKIPFPFNIEKIIDDWIFMTFLVGNNYIPHLPNLHIDSGALDALQLVYMEILPTFDGYINEAGTLNLERFEKFMEKLSQGEADHLTDHLADLKLCEAKFGRRLNETENINYGSSKDCPESFAPPKKSVNEELSAVIQSTIDMSIGHFDEGLNGDSDIEMNKIEFMQHKRDYYMNKLGYDNVDAEVLRSHVEAYVTAIQWNLHYYYDGCCSWSWYYPHLYAPYISDIKNFKDLKINFSLDEPYLPFQQLLAVLPAASKSLLPEAYQGLVSDEQSPIIDYYPEDFKLDLHQKKHVSETIALIPFIDAKRLFDAMEPCNDKLTTKEQNRNKHGPICVITYTEDDMGLYEAPQYYPSVQSHAKMQLVTLKDIEVPKEKLVKGLSKGVRFDLPGFPTFQQIKHEAKLKPAQVKEFELLWGGKNMVISILPSEVANLHDVAGKMLGKTIFVNWPYLQEARAIGVSTINRKITLINSQQGYSPENLHIEDFNLNLPSQWHLQCNSATETYMTRYGIDVGDTSVLLYALPMIGKQYLPTTSGKMSLDKVWAKNPVLYVYQAVVTDIAVSDSCDVLHHITDIYTVKSTVFMLGHPLYGAMGEVINSGVNIETGKVHVAMRIDIEPNLDSIKNEFTNSEAQWISANMVARRSKIKCSFLNRLTGSIIVSETLHETPGNIRHDIGLNLKLNNRNEQVLGYTKKSCGEWWYSPKAVATIQNYTQRYPKLMKLLSEGRLMSEVFNKDDLIAEGSENLEDVLAWLKEQPCTKLKTQSCDDRGLDPDTIAKITNVIDKLMESNQNDTEKTVLMQVKPHLLFKPGSHLENLVPDLAAQHKLFDRIISVKERSMVPLGYKGTIVEIENYENTSDKVYDVLFDRRLVGGISFAGTTNRRVKLHDVHFINISHGMRSKTDIASNTSGMGQAPAPQKSWRQDPGNSKKQSQSNAIPPTWRNQRTSIVLFPTCSQNNKNANTDPAQLRPMKKNEGQTNRSSQSFGKQNTEPRQNPSETRAPKTTPEVREIKSMPVNTRMPRVNGTSEFQMWNEPRKPWRQDPGCSKKTPRN